MILGGFHTATTRLAPDRRLVASVLASPSAANRYGCTAPRHRPTAAGHSSASSCHSVFVTEIWPRVPRRGERRSLERRAGRLRSSLRFTETGVCHIRSAISASMKRARRRSPCRVRRRSCRTRERHADTLRADSSVAGLWTRTEAPAKARGIQNDSLEGRGRGRSALDFRRQPPANAPSSTLCCARRARLAIGDCRASASSLALDEPRDFCRSPPASSGAATVEAAESPTHLRRARRLSAAAARGRGFGVVIASEFFSGRGPPPHPKRTRDLTRLALELPVEF